MKRADEGMGFLLRYENVAWYEDGAVRILDRRIYPVKTEYVICTKHEEVAKAIGDMVTQSGGPYTAAAMGMALAAHEARNLAGDELVSYMEKAAYTLSHARPTTVAKMVRITDGALDLAKKLAGEGRNGEEITEPLREYAFNYINNNYLKYEKVGKYLADLIPQNGTIMTQCFAETIIGTLIRECHRRNNDIKMICAETRPYFQGARLTASVAYDMGVDVAVITDNMPGFILKEKHVDVFTSAADVITMDGYVVNKVGTFQIALAAAYHGIPYFATGTPNPDHSTIDTVNIEYRDPELVMEAMGTKVTKEGVKAYYPAFDITPPKLCNGIVTDKGVYSPYDLEKYFQKTVE
ncbi:MAG TPA: S-methyl-5-thioribose-1-phosphate isomerase [Candidatus Lachnoclostridium pullistercoris]|uniref:S-methyl-5-thioribose-1-phosphate isomerase n=1 Tax=Candidatus Lachnoclostridium pullistercoris TaxID=2838632 RepID=A0A9D2PDC6_9FIRM|nr:S-methyl-5-thioribose-1-phosphate isomerase [Candidatus Lachnoclostridium pullistercoris]